MIWNRKTVILSISVLFVLLLAGGLFYYFKYYKIGADTLPRNTSCVIKVVDSQTKQPVKGATASFNVFPENPISLSKEDGCVALPEQLVDTQKGDYYQVDLYQPGYNEELIHLPINQQVISGKKIQETKLLPTNLSVSIPDKLKENNINKFTSTNKINLIDNAKADESRELSLNISAYDNLSKKILEGVEIVLRASNSNGGVSQIGSCVTTDPKISYYCQFKIKEEIIKYIRVQSVASHPDYETAYNLLSDFDLTEKVDPGKIYIYIPMKPILVENEIGVYTGKSLSSKCQGTTDIKVTWIGAKGSFEQKLWDHVSIQAISDNLATVICALEQSEPPPPMQTFKIQILNANPSVENRGYASVYRKEASIVGINQKWCGNLKNDSAELNVCRNTSKDYLFNMPVHEYGHILDLFNSGGIFSNNPNFLNLFKLINYSDDLSDTYDVSLFADCNGFNSEWATDTIYADSYCYFATNPREFWATSFNLWMGQSLAKDLGLDISKMKNFSIPIDESSLSSQGLNVYKFWKSFMASALGSNCHPIIMDANGRKTGLTYAPPFDLASNSASTFVAGGILWGGYPPDDILAGKATSGPYLQATFKILPQGYQASGLTIGISMQCSVSAGSSTRSCFYGPYSISLKDTDMVGVAQNKVLMMPQAGMSKYDIVATYKCPNGTEASKTLESGLELNTQQPNREITIDFTQFPSCSSNTMPNQPSGTQNNQNTAPTSPTGPGMPGAQ